MNTHTNATAAIPADYCEAWKRATVAKIRIATLATAAAAACVASEKEATAAAVEHVAHCTAIREGGEYNLSLGEASRDWHFIHIANLERRNRLDDMATAAAAAEKRAESAAVAGNRDALRSAVCLALRCEIRARRLSYRMP